MPVKRTKSGEPWIDPAKLRTPITFLIQHVAPDRSGVAATWLPASPPDITRAEIVQVNGMDLIKSGQDVSQLPCVVTIRYTAPGRTASMRFQDPDGNVYVIQAVANLDPGRKKYQQLTSLLLGANV